MGKLDPQLEFLVDGGADAVVETKDTETVAQFGLESIEIPVKKGKPKEKRVEASVLVQFSGDPADLKKAGIKVRGVAGDVVTGRIAVKDLSKLAKIDAVERIEAARSMQPELDLSVPEIRADLVHAGPPGRRGSGVIVGIVDTGCDYTHPTFQNSDGTTRILAIWDQGLTPQSGESSPSGLGYGVEYSQTDINSALSSANPFNVVRHRDPHMHGTHVTGIAAGNGSVGGQGQPAGTFVGVAPEADIIVVANSSNGTEGLGTSANTLDAVNYIFQRAQELDQACVVNMSLGDNLGPHDGTSLLERGLDNLLGAQGRAFVKSAGNAGSGRVHAGGTVMTGASTEVRFNQPSGDVFANQIDMWYEGGDTFRISIIDPAGDSVGPVNVGTASTLSFPSGNRVRIDHRNNDPFNGDKRVFMTISRGTQSSILTGTWRIRVQSVSSASRGRFDAWIQRGWRGNPVPSFLSPHESSAMTISTPGTAQEVITAANYSSRGFSAGALRASSSRGPTRDGRVAPTIAAPGVDVFSSRAEFGTGDPWLQMSGTSMSAPHVTGTIALMFQKNGNRTQDQIRQCLTSTARQDANTGPVPNTAWGAGKLDAQAAVNCVPIFGVRSVPRTTCPRPSVVTVTCPSRVVTRCVSVPRTTCLRPSVVPATCPSQTTRCVSVPPTTCLRPSVVASMCPSRVTRCVTVPRTTCLRPSVAAGDCPSQPTITCGGPQSVLRCPSAVDDCPSAPAGCFDPVSPIDPVVQPGGGFRPFRPEDMGWEGEQDWSSCDADAEAMDHEAHEIELPPEGYFDYDENWFEDE